MTEVRPAIVEKNVQAPIVKQEGFIEQPKVLREEKGRIEVKPAEAPVEDRSTLGGMISGVLSDIKHTIVGDEGKNK